MALFSAHRHTALAAGQSGLRAVFAVNSEAIALVKTLSRLALWSCLLLAGNGWAPAQEGEAPAAPSDDDRPDTPAAASQDEHPLAEELLPPLYMLDKDGKLVPAVGMTPQDFQELLKLKNQLDRRETRPRYTLQEVAISGSAEPDRALLNVKITLMAGADGWIRVPLRFDQAVLRSDTVHEGEGRWFLDYEEHGGGYVAWLDTTSGAVHELTLEMAVPLETAAGESRLQLTVPRATRSQLDLDVPLAAAAARVARGGLLMETASADGGGTRLNVQRLDGEMEIAWWNGAARRGERGVDLEASGAMLARIDGTSARIEATLKVRSFNGTFDRFRIRLPPAARLVGGEQLGYQLSTLPLVGPEQRCEVVEVRLDQGTSESVEVQLVTEQPSNSASAADGVDLAGFEVLGAVRQSGVVAVRVVGDWQVLWGRHDPAVRRVQELPQELAQNDVAAAFEYFRQPFALAARIVPRETRLQVEPRYVFQIAPPEVGLLAQLKYTVRGAKAFAVDVDFTGWEIDDVGPANLVDIDRAALDRVAPLTIPLLQPVTGAVEVVVKAHRTLAPDARSVELALPSPSARSVSPAAVVILPADNVALRPRTYDIAGLTRQPVGPAIELPPHQQTPFFYRGTGAEAKFVADFDLQPRAVQVDIATRIDLRRTPCQVEQRLTYKVSHQSVSSLTLDVPPALAQSDRVVVLLDGQRLSTARLAASETDQNGTVPLLIDLAGDRIGTFELLVRFEVPPGQPASQSLRVPLAMPHAGTLAGNHLIVHAPSGLAVRPQGKGWRETPPEGSAAAAEGNLQLSSAEPRGEIVFRTVPDAAAGADEIRVDRAWIQTRLNDRARVDRAVFRFSSRQPSLEIVLPRDADGSGLTVRLDRQPARFRQSGRRLAVELPQSRRSWHVLDLEYPFEHRAPAGRRMVLEGPVFPQRAWVRQLYWQVIAPPSEHLLVGPLGFAGECTWTRDGIGWGRRPTLDEQALESWTGAEAVGGTPAAANVYLFSRMGRADRCEVLLVRRSLLVFAASLAALAGGLLLLYVPWCRTRGALLAGTVLLAAAGSLYPEPALLVLEAAGLGIGLALVALVLRGVSTRRRFRKALARRSPSSVTPWPGAMASVSSGAMSFHRRADSNPPVSTATAAAPTSLPAVESGA